MAINSQTVVLALLALVVIVFIICGCMKKGKINSRENYQDLFYAKDYAKDNWVSRPNFKANLDPRFDSNRFAGNIQGSFPGMSVQGAPVTPVESIVSSRADVPSYATMGGVNAAYADPKMPSGGLTTSQVNNILAQKFGRSPETYVDPKDLLPVPDMKKALAKDPSDPGLFMYDRYLFAPLKRRYANVQVDRIRGDLAIPQLRTGWFDARPVANQDLVQGYFSDYIDIQQSSSIRDSIFERKPEALKLQEDNSAWGALNERVVNALV